MEPHPAELRTHSEATTSIQNLPNELLSAILHISIQDLSPSLKRVQELSTVSSHWREVAEGTPLLWSRVTGDDPLRAVVTALEKSKDSSLDVRYDFTSRRRITEVGESLRAVCAHIDRWQHASIIMLWIPEGLLEDLALRTAPRLETFRLRVTLWTDVTLTLFQGVPSQRLKELDIYRIATRWDENQFRNLRALAVTSNGVCGPSLAELLPVLQNLPELEELTLGPLQHPYGNDIDIPSQQPVTLHALNSLTIEGGGLVGVVDIASCLRAPICQNIKVVGEIFREGVPLDIPAELDMGVRHFIPAICSNMEEGERVTIRVTKHLQVHSGTSLAKFLFFAGSGAHEIAKWMMDNIPGRDTEIGLTVELPVFSKEHLVSLVSSHPHPRITKLDIRLVERGGSSIVHYLSSPDSALASGGAWPLPYLTGLAVSSAVCGVDLARILRMLRARARGTGSAGIIGPRTISSLEIRSFDTDSALDGDLMMGIGKFLRETGGTLIGHPGFQGT